MLLDKSEVANRCSREPNHQKQEPAQSTFHSYTHTHYTYTLHIHTCTHTYCTGTASGHCHTNTLTVYTRSKSHYPHQMTTPNLPRWTQCLPTWGFQNSYGIMSILGRRTARFPNKQSTKNMLTCRLLHPMFSKSLTKLPTKVYADCKSSTCHCVILNLSIQRRTVATRTMGRMRNEQKMNGNKYRTKMR